MPEAEYASYLRSRSLQGYPLQREAGTATGFSELIREPRGDAQAAPGGVAVVADSSAIDSSSAGTPPTSTEGSQTSSQPAKLAG
jgi:hypothetical protein